MCPVRLVKGSGEGEWGSGGISWQVPLNLLCAPPRREVKPDPTPLLAARHNVFQNDEFDVFSRDAVDLSRVHKGRR